MSLRAKSRLLLARSKELTNVFDSDTAMHSIESVAVQAATVAIITYCLRHRGAVNERAAYLNGSSRQSHVAYRKSLCVITVNGDGSE